MLEDTEVNSCVNYTQKLDANHFKSMNKCIDPNNNDSTYAPRFHPKPKLETIRNANLKNMSHGSSDLTQDF